MILLAQESAVAEAAEASIMDSAIFQLPPPFNMIVLVVALFAVGAVIKSVAKQIRLFIDHEADRRLKRDMIEAGLTGEEARELAETQIYHDNDPKS